MHKIDAATLVRYQKILAEDPQSQLFAPLAEGLRQHGRLKDAERVVRHGIERHPAYPAGLLVFGKILKDLKRPEDAISVFKSVIQLDPTNLLSYQCLGDLYLENSQPKDALKFYKMVLFLNPQSQKAQRVILKLESLTADEFTEETFKMTPLKVIKPAPAAVPIEKEKTPETNSVPKGLQRMLSLVDAFIVRNDLAKAQYLLSETEVEFGDHPEIQQRRKVLYNRQASQLAKDANELDKITPLMNRESLIRQKKLDLLQATLRVIARVSGSPLAT